MPIDNPNPIPLGTVADKYWCASLHISALVRAQLVPFDGAYLVGNPTLEKSIRAVPDPAVFEPLKAAVRMMAGKASDVPIDSIAVEAPDPARPVSVLALFDDDTSHEEADLFALAGSSPQVGGIMQAVYGWLSAEAAKPTQPYISPARQREIQAGRLEAAKAGDWARLAELTAEMKGVQNGN